MAINKSDVCEFDHEMVDIIEKQIDRRLSAPLGDGMLTFDTTRWTGGMKREIERRYKAAGWTVEFVDDQRDGAFMVLK